MLKIAESCHCLLNNFSEAQSCLDYLDSRLSKESQSTFQFGFFPSNQNLNVLLDSVQDELIKYKLIYSRQISDSLGPRTIYLSYFENYPLMIPYRDVYGNVIALVGRTFLSEQERKQQGLSKYKNTVFKKSQHLFGLYENHQSITDNDSVYVVEGQFDVVKAYEIGFRNVVALGGSNMSSHQFALLLRYTNNIFLLLDNDDAGNKGRNNIMHSYGKYANIQNFYLPNYKDVDEYISNTGVKCFEDIEWMI